MSIPRSLDPLLTLYMLPLGSQCYKWRWDNCPIWDCPFCGWDRSDGTSCLYIFAWWLCGCWSPLTNSIIFLLLPQLQSLMLCRGFMLLNISMAMALRYLILLLNAVVSSELTLDADSCEWQMFRCVRKPLSLWSCNTCYYYHAYIHSNTSTFNSAICTATIHYTTITTIMAKLCRGDTLPYPHGKVMHLTQ